MTMGGDAPKAPVGLAERLLACLHPDASGTLRILPDLLAAMRAEAKAVRDPQILEGLGNELTRLTELLRQRDAVDAARALTAITEEIAARLLRMPRPTGPATTRTSEVRKNLAAERKKTQTPTAPGKGLTPGAGRSAGLRKR